MLNQKKKKIEIVSEIVWPVKMMQSEPIATARMSGRWSSNLALDIYFAKCSFFSRFEKKTSPASEQPETILSFFEEALAIGVDQELNTVAIRFEAELFCDESDIQVGFVPFKKDSSGKVSHQRKGDILTLYICWREP